MGRPELIGPEQAEARATSEAPVIVVGEDAAAVGREVATRRAAGVRAAGFVGSPGETDVERATVEMAAELFPHDDVVVVVRF